MKTCLPDSEDDITLAETCFYFFDLKFSFFVKPKYKAIFDFASIGFFVICCYVKHWLGSFQGQLPLQSCICRQSVDPLFQKLASPKNQVLNPLRQNPEDHAQHSSRYSPMVVNSSPDSASLILHPADPVAAALWLHNSEPPLGCRPRLSLQLERPQPDARQPHHPLSPHCRFQEDGAQRGG